LLSATMSSGSSAARELLAGFVAGRIPAQRLVPAIAAEYYRSADAGKRAALRPVMDVIERAAPGVARLARTESGAGFDIQLAERPFPDAFETPLREAAAGVLAGAWSGAAAVSGAPTLETTRPPEPPGFWSRLVERVRRLFSAST
jgi:hypothetical protein